MNKNSDDLGKLSEKFSNEKIQSREARKQYWWGLLGLIPLIGAIVGLVLLLIGIFRYKDPKLILIGASAILFTVCIYSYLFHEMEYGEETANGFAQISQIQINSLVKEIEFYKMQNGCYPINLDQLTKDGNWVTIVDPLLLSKSTSGNLNYRYQKIGSKYKLFSVGVDRIENTKDDIFPIIKNTDMNKLGLIR